MTGEFDGLSLHRLRQRLSTYRARDQAWNTRLWHLPAILEITKTAIVTAKVIELGLKQLFTFITMWRSLGLFYFMLIRRWRRNMRPPTKLCAWLPGNQAGMLSITLSRSLVLKAIRRQRNGTLFWRAQTRAAAYAKLSSMTGGLVPKERHADRLLVLPKAQRLTWRA